jgi:predicted nucleic acid-binding protein
MYLLDTNIILELLLDQENADEVEQLLRNISPQSFHLSEFSLYSLGVILIRRNMHDLLVQSIEDLLITGGIRQVRLEVEDIQNIVNISQRFNLDFDDAYQYVVAEKYDLIIVSFDRDFDRTERGKRTPSQVLS